MEERTVFEKHFIYAAFEHEIWYFTNSLPYVTDNMKYTLIFNQWNV